VQQLFTALLGRPVQVTAAAKAPVPAAVASYIDDQGALVAVATCDLELACGAGGALSMMPPGVIKDALKSKAIDEAMGENLQEVLNVAAQLWHNPGAPHIRLREVSTFDQAPPDAKATITQAGTHRTLNVQVGGYGGGLLAFHAA
jgi:hypothetical protein